MTATNSLLYFPTEQNAVSQWSFFNQSLHDDIVAAIRKQKNVALPTYLLDPFPHEGIEDWLARHQQAHDDMNGVLNYPGQDLQSVDFKDEQQRRIWAYLHFQDHFNASQVLNIP